MEGSLHRLQVPLPADTGASTVWLVVPACPGRLAIRAGEARWGPLPPSWTERRFPIPPGVEEVRLECVSVEDDPFAGFLAAIGSPPRGLWQGTRWELGGPVAFRRRPALRWIEGRLTLSGELVFAGETTGDQPEILIDGREVQPGADPGRWTLDAAGPEPTAWSPDHPELVTADVELRLAGRLCERLELPVVRHELRADGETLRLNGERFRVQGLLHWGYYPELDGPDPEPTRLREELGAMKVRGFNLLKACLWMPPHRFLDACDQAGMAVWLEYPLWNHPLRESETGASGSMVRRYADLVAHDAAHPCVFLRTLTCENDEVDHATARQVRADIAAVAPGGLTNDNSAWIDHVDEPEFWDEHPYLNAAQWPFYLERTRRALDRREPKPFLLGETMAFDSLEDAASRRAAVRLRRRQVEGLRSAFPDAGYVICAARDIPQSPLGVQDQSGAWKTPVADWSWQAEAAEPLPVSPPARRPIEVPDGVVIEETLDGQVIQRIADGACVFHPTSPRSAAWRAPEHTFWSPVASFDAVLGDDRIPLGDLVFEELLAGRALVHPPREQARFLVAARDVHDRSGAETVQPFVLVARIGEGSLLITALRTDNEAGLQFHESLLQRFAHEGPSWVADLDDLVMDPPPRSFFLDGPWTLRGPGVRHGEQSIVPGTLLANQGRNAVQGWVDATATVQVPTDWTGPLLLRAEAVGDGFELLIDGRHVHTHGRPGFTWDAGRDVPVTLDLGSLLPPGSISDWRIRTKDHRGAGALIGPLYLVSGDPTSSLLY